jgi:hypothetical protein
MQDLCGFAGWCRNKDKDKDKDKDKVKDKMGWLEVMGQESNDVDV